MFPKKNPPKLETKQKFWLIGENLPYAVRHLDSIFILGCRDLDLTEDDFLLRREVEAGRFQTVKEAFQKMRKQEVYIIYNLRQRKRKGPHNLDLSDYDLNSPFSVGRLFKDMNLGRAFVFTKTDLDANIDYDVTFDR